MSNVSIKGFVDITVFNEDGTVKQHQYKENTLTRAALASMFCDFLFRGDSALGGSAGSATEGDNYYACLERSTNSNRMGTNDTLGGTSVRDLVLQGTHGTRPVAPIFSHRQPNKLGLYCLSTPIQAENNLSPGQLKFDERTQVAPYVKPDGSTLSDYAVFYNTGTAASNFYPEYETTSPQFVRSMIECSFTLPDLCFTCAFRKSNGSGTIRSVVWGAAHPLDSTAAEFQNRVFDVRARILSHSNFNYAGYSPFYATEQRLIPKDNSDIPHTILWQDILRPDNSHYGDLGTREIFGYDLTSPGSNDTTGENGALGNHGVERFSVSSWLHMEKYMQGVIIGNNAFGLDNDTDGGTTPSVTFSTGAVRVYRVANWKTNSSASNITVTFDMSSAGYTTITYSKPVLAHNLRTGKLELFFTPSYNTTTKRYRVGKAIINPTTFAVEGAISYYDSDFCISNYRLSMPGTNTAINNAAYPRARAVTGFIDYNTDGITTPVEYYLPYVYYYDSVVGAHLPTPGQESVNVDPGQYLRLGVQCTFIDTELVPIRLYLQGYPCSGNGSPSNTLAAYEYNNLGTRGVYGVYRYTLWAYTMPTTSGVQPPLQFIPLTGNSCLSGSFSMVLPSQVLCGLDLDEPVTKAATEVLVLKYGWKISQASS